MERLSLWESWREAPERARMPGEKHKHSDSIALRKSLLIAVSWLSGDELALSVCCADTSPRGRGFWTGKNELLFSPELHFPDLQNRPNRL
jgi:hypothetical protein